MPDPVPSLIGPLAPVPPPAAENEGPRSPKAGENPPPSDIAADFALLLQSRSLRLERRMPGGIFRLDLERTGKAHASASFFERSPFRDGGMRGAATALVAPVAWMMIEGGARLASLRSRGKGGGVWNPGWELFGRAIVPLEGAALFAGVARRGFERSAPHPEVYRDVTATVALEQGPFEIRADIGYEYDWEKSKHIFESRTLRSEGALAVNVCEDASVHVSASRSTTRVDRFQRRKGFVPVGGVAEKNAAAELVMKF